MQAGMSLRSIEHKSSDFAVSFSNFKEKPPAVLPSPASIEEDQLGIELTKRQIEIKKAVEFESHANEVAEDDIWLRTVLACEYYTDLDAVAIPNRNLQLTVNELGYITDVLKGLHTKEAKDVHLAGEWSEGTAYEAYKQAFDRVQACPHLSTQIQIKQAPTAVGKVSQLAFASAGAQGAHSTVSSAAQSLLAKMNQAVSNRANYWGTNKYSLSTKSASIALAAKEGSNKSKDGNDNTEENSNDLPKESSCDFLRKSPAATNGVTDGDKYLEAQNCESAVQSDWESNCRNDMHSDAGLNDESAPKCNSNGQSAPSDCAKSADFCDLEPFSVPATQADTKKKVQDPRLRRLLAGTVANLALPKVDTDPTSARPASDNQDVLPRPDSPSKLNFDCLPDVVNSIKRTLARIDEATTGRRTLALGSPTNTCASESGSTVCSIASPDVNKSSSTESRKDVPTVSDADELYATDACFSDDDDDPFEYLQCKDSGNGLRSDVAKVRSGNTAHCLLRKLRAVTRDFSFHTAFVDRARRSAFVQYEPANDPRLYITKLTSNAKARSISIYVDVFRNEQASILSVPPQSVVLGRQKMTVEIPLEFTKSRSVMKEPTRTYTDDDVPPLVRVVQTRREVVRNLKSVAFACSERVGAARKRARATNEVIVISSDEDSDQSPPPSKCVRDA